VISLDLTARRVVCASMLYYGLDQSVMSDAEFDEACKRLAAEFDQLGPIRQWQLDSAEAIAASGFKIKVTVAAANAAVSWLKTTQPNATAQIMRNWRTPRGKPRYLLPSDFRIG